MGDHARGASHKSTRGWPTLRGCAANGSGAPHGRADSPEDDGDVGLPATRKAGHFDDYLATAVALIGGPLGPTHPKPCVGADSIFAQEAEGVAGCLHPVRSRHTSDTPVGHPPRRTKRG